MNALTLSTDSNTISSLWIADNTGKSHSHVMRDINSMVSKINQSISGSVKNGKDDTLNSNGYLVLKEEYKDSKGEMRNMYTLNKKASLLLASSYNHVLRMKIIDRWEELEAEKAQSFVVPQSFSQALLLAAQQAEQIEKQNAQLQEQQGQILQLTSAVASMEKKVTYMDKIFACPSTVKVTTIAQDYGMSAKAFNNLLHNFGIQYKCGDVWVLYAKYLPDGYVKDVPFEYTRNNGSTAVTSNMQWTQKGRAWLYETLKQRGVLPLIEK